MHSSFCIHFHYRLLSRSMSYASYAYTILIVSTITQSPCIYLAFTCAGARLVLNSGEMIHIDRRGKYIILLPPPPPPLLLLLLCTE